MRKGDQTDSKDKNTRGWLDKKRRGGGGLKTIKSEWGGEKRH